MLVKFSYITLVIFVGFAHFELITVYGQSLTNSTKIAATEVKRKIVNSDAETEAVIRGLAQCQLPSQKGNSTAGGETFSLPPEFKHDKESSRHFIHGGSVWRNGEQTFKTIAGHWGLSSFPKPSSTTQWCKLEQDEQLFLIITQTSNKQLAITMWSFNNSPFGSIIYEITSLKVEDKKFFLRILQTISTNTIDKVNPVKGTTDCKAENE